MSELDDAIVRLDAAVARLEVASAAAKRGAEQDRAQALQAEQMEDERVRGVAAAIAGRVEAALAKLGLLLEREG